MQHAFPPVRLCGWTAKLYFIHRVHGCEEDHRLWIAVDELDALGAINGLPDALARPLLLKSVTRTAEGFGGRPHSWLALSTPRNNCST
jgi:hypothetical protein